MLSVVLVCPVASLVHHHDVQAVALLLHGLLLVHALDPRLTITQVGMKAPNSLLDHLALSHQAGKHHFKLQLRHQLWYGHSLARISKVSHTLQFFLVFSLVFFLFIFYFKFFFYSKICVHQPQEMFIHQASRVN